jgi:hypothetical protein
LACVFTQACIEVKGSFEAPLRRAKETLSEWAILDQAGAYGQRHDSVASLRARFSKPFLVKKETAAGTGAQRQGYPADALTLFQISALVPVNHEFL